MGVLRLDLFDRERVGTTGPSCRIGRSRKKKVFGDVFTCYTQETVGGM